MGASAAASVGKKALCDHLGWSRPTLDKRLKTDRNFPVVSRGDQSGGWSFDPVAVDAYLGVKPCKRPVPAVDKAQLRDIVAPPLPTTPAPKPTRRSAHHAGEATARQRKDDADAGIREVKLAQLRGELLDKAATRAMLLEISGAVAQFFEGLPEELIKASGGSLTDDHAPLIRNLLDNERRELRRRLGPIIDGGTVPADPGQDKDE
jgi:hypothetical protein